MITSRKILITGGLGFIGLHLAKLLLHEGNFVVLLDIQELKSSSFSEMELQLGEKLQHIQLDILGNLHSIQTILIILFIQRSFGY